MENNFDARLELLKDKLGLKWNELAGALGISVPLLGFIRRGDRHPSEKVLRAIVALEESGVSAKNATAAELQAWKSRALRAESKLQKMREAIRNFNKVVENLEGAIL